MCLENIVQQLEVGTVDLVEVLADVYIGHMESGHLMVQHLMDGQLVDKDLVQRNGGHRMAGTVQVQP